VVQSLYLNAREENDRLRQEIEKLRSRIAELENQMAEGESRVEAMRKALEDLRIMAGLTPVSGPGVIITLDDRNVKAPVDVDINGLIIHDTDLLQIVNDLKAAGAEAISINGQRIVAMSAIRCSGPIIQVNGVAIPSPFEIRAIGDPDVLESAIKLPGGILSQLQMPELQQWGLRVEVVKTREVEVPALAVTPTLKYAVPTAKKP
jgi:uncharacterized protein YlxW (UPF0749 family)